MSQTSAHRLPLTMQTVFQDLLLLTFSVAPERLASLLPPPVHAYIRNGRSYISIVVGNMRGMRPGNVPEFLGTNYYQIVYRAVVRLYHRNGQVLPGVFFLRSDSNDPVMSYFGNRLSEFRFHYFHTGAIELFARGEDLLISVETKDKGGDLVAHARDLGSAAELAPTEGFTSLADEKETLVQLFHAYAYEPDRRLIYDLEIERGDWLLHRLDLREYFSAYFMETPFDAASASPVSHVYTRQCSYIWKPMRIFAADEFAYR
ncbi:MAG: DUF2071 domain-containing protein [Ktedonobacterales bacterium]